MPKLLIAASGTGGHLFPALAVADELPLSWSIYWLGVPDRLEVQLVPNRYELITVRAGGIQGKGFKKLLQFVQLLLATVRVRDVLREQKTDIVFTTGGYIAAPAILAAMWCGLPVILHESNAFPGTVTRFLGRFCQKIALGLPVTSEHLSKCRTVITGTPVRKAFHESQSLPTWIPPGNGPLLLVMGGSQGAVGLNRMARAAFPVLLGQGCRIVHLTGSNDPEVGKLVHQNFVEKTFSNEIPALLQHADLVVSRAGASALSELAISAAPAVLVPYPAAKDKHQDFNAVIAAQLGAAVIVHEHTPNEKALLDTLTRLLKTRLIGKNLFNDPLKLMSLAMKSLAAPNANRNLIELLRAAK